MFMGATSPFDLRERSIEGKGGQRTEIESTGLHEAHGRKN